ncbi:DegV family protein [uncultured Eubacterium sp.]|uniref:DegV family protein n=1 Tax=uncultured Eubacterium sp. TaxID=165185 RepID=UPI002593FF4B|nr:DegV family protein [uncultured Eubacterium sp.]
MKTAVMTDSNSGITPEEGKKLGIYSLPMPVIIEGDVFYEGKNITQEEYYGAMTSGKNVTTSQPSPGDVMDMWDGILKEGYEQVVYIPMSSGLSASCHAAIQLSEEYDGKVQVVDDHRISVTMRESVLEAKWMANQGMTAEEIKKRLEENAYNSSIYIAVDTLEYLKKGGRVTAAGAAIGAVLNIKPVLTIQGEKLDAFTKVRGIKKAELKMLEAIEEDLNTRFADVDRKQLRLGAAGTFQKQEDADQWYKMVKDTFENEIDDIYYDPLSFSIGCHVGPNAIGIGISVITRDEK